MYPGIAGKGVNVPYNEYIRGCDCGWPGGYRPETDRKCHYSKPIGNVIIQSGKTTFSAKKGVFLAPGFEVKKGASFEAKIVK